MKVKISSYKKSVYETNINKEMQALIWDFYVTRSFANSASQKRAVKDFGRQVIPFKEMIAIAGISEENCKILPCTTMKNTITKLEFDTEQKNNGVMQEVEIDIDTPRMCCLQAFTVSEELKVETKSSSQADCLFTHIRNAFAHGNTYFFDNGNVLLEDKDRRKITAKILIAVEILIKWIELIDVNHTVYPELDDGVYVPFRK